MPVAVARRDADRLQEAHRVQGHALAADRARPRHHARDAAERAAIRRRPGRMARRRARALRGRRRRCGRPAPTGPGRRGATSPAPTRRPRCAGDAGDIVALSRPSASTPTGPGGDDRSLDRGSPAHPCPRGDDRRARGLPGGRHGRLRQPGRLREREGRRGPELVAGQRRGRLDDPGLRDVDERQQGRDDPLQDQDDVLELPHRHLPARLLPGQRRAAAAGGDPPDGDAAPDPARLPDDRGDGTDRLRQLGVSGVVDRPRPRRCPGSTSHAWCATTPAARARSRSSSATTRRHRTSLSRPPTRPGRPTTSTAATACTRARRRARPATPGPTRARSRSPTTGPSTARSPRTTGARTSSTPSTR